MGMIGGGRVKIVGFPEIDGDVLRRILAPQGTPLEEMESIVKHVVNSIMQVNTNLKPRQPGNQDLIQNVVVHYSQNLDAHETGPHVATVSVDLLAAEIRTSDLETVTGQWRQEVGSIPRVINITYKEPAIGPGGLPIDIRLQGEDLTQMKRASLELLAWLKQYEGVLIFRMICDRGNRKFRFE